MLLMLLKCDEIDTCKLNISECLKFVRLVGTHKMLVYLGKTAEYWFLLTIPGVSFWLSQNTAISPLPSLHLLLKDGLWREGLFYSLWLGLYWLYWGPATAGLVLHSGINTMSGITISHTIITTFKKTKYIFYYAGKHIE